MAHGPRPRRAVQAVLGRDRGQRHPLRAGCVLGDLIAEWTVFAAGLQLAGFALPVEYPFDYVLALSWGILFQYYVIQPMRHLPVREGLKRAAKADFLARDRVAQLLADHLWLPAGGVSSARTIGTGRRWRGCGGETGFAPRRRKAGDGGAVPRVAGHFAVAGREGKQAPHAPSWRRPGCGNRRTGEKTGAGMLCAGG
jgi:Domain of unknown function (DUF4396)